MSLDTNLAESGALTMCAADSVSMTAAPTDKVPAALALRRFLRLFTDSLLKSTLWLVGRVRTKDRQKKLRVCESVPLGDRRFVALIQVEGERFLIGGAASSVSLLARLESSKTFSETLKAASLERGPL